MACDQNKSWTKGGCVPVVPYESDGSCAGPAGGTVVAEAPPFELAVTNPVDLTWRDEDFTPIQSDEDDTIWEFDNVL